MLDRVPRDVLSSANSITQGAAAGIGVGAGIGGLLLGALVAYLILMYRSRRKTVHKSRRHQQVRHLSHSHGEPIGPAALNLRDYLPQPTDDSTLCDELTALSTFIEQHVDNFYDNDFVPEKILPSVTSASSDDEGDRLKLNNLLRNPSAQSFAIRHIILRNVLAAISPTGDPKQTLLPQDIVQLRNRMGLQGKDNPEVFNVALSRWRLLSSYLLHLSRKPSSRDEGAISPSIEANVRALDETLAPFYRASIRRESREAHLINIMKRASHFGILLFSHPAAWSLDWASSARGKRDGRVGVVVRPALVRTSDDEGKVLKNGLVALPAEEIFVAAQ